MMNHLAVYALLKLFGVVKGWDNGIAPKDTPVQLIDGLDQVLAADTCGCVAD